MSRIFISLVIASFTGSILAAIVVFFKKRFSPHLNYYIWLMVLFVMLFPLKLNFPYTSAELHSANVSGAVMSKNYISITEENTETEEKTSDNYEDKNKADVKSTSGYLEKISYIWIIGVLLIFLKKIICYIAFLNRIRNNSYLGQCEEIKKYTNQNINIRYTGESISPFVHGIISPTLVLPDIPFSKEMLMNILAHEAIHLKRKDVLYKWFATIVKCIHWFNPVVYLVAERINRDCEISCDAIVTSNMDHKDKLAYVDTILMLLKTDNFKTTIFSTAMTNNTKILKERFEAIRNKNTVTKRVAFISAALVLVIAVFTMAFGGMINGLIFKNNDSIKLFNNNKEVIFDNKPFVENTMVYFPLEELLTKLDGDNNLKLIDDEYEIYIKKSIDLYKIKPDVKSINYSAKEISSEGIRSLARRDTEYSPIVKNKIIYIPYEYVEYIFIHSGNYDIKGSVLYQNKDMNIQLQIPLSWSGKYYVDTSGVKDNTIRFYHKRISEKYDFAGRLFSVEKMTLEQLEDSLAVYGNMKEVWKNKEYAFVIAEPTDVQHPIWLNHDKEDITLAEEYEKMAEDIELIGASFSIISKRDIDDIELNSRFGEIRLLDNMNNGKTIKKNKNGYKVNSYAIAETGFNTNVPDFNGELPSRIKAWYEEDGENKRCVGKADAPYTQIPIKLILDFSLQNVKNGELQFEAEYKNGIKEMSEIIKIYK